MPYTVKHLNPIYTETRNEAEPRHIKFGAQSRKEVEDSHDKKAALTLLGITAGAYLVYKLLQASGAISYEVGAIDN